MSSDVKSARYPLSLKLKETDQRRATLIEGLKNRDENALQQLMHLYKNKIFNYLYLLLKDRETAEELTQDTFVKAYFKAHTLKTHNINPWLYKIATNLARSQWRKNRIKTFVPLPDSHREVFSFFPRFEEELVTRETIDRIPEKYRIPFILKTLRDFSYEDISQILNKPVGTVKSLVFRAKAKIRKEYEIPT